MIANLTGKGKRKALEKDNYPGCIKTFVFFENREME